jgi:hypothetical protein
MYCSLYSVCIDQLFIQSPSLSVHLEPSVPLSDEANVVVSESTDMEDVSTSTAITTNFIGQKTEKLGADMCEELSTMFQELKGLRVVVGNLIDGLQKVVCTVVLQSGKGSGQENKKIVHYLSNKA